MPIDLYDLSMILLIPAILIGLWAQWRVNSAFKRYSQIHGSNGWTAATMAREILAQEGLEDVQITQSQGNLTDHYDPSKRILALSPQVYDSPSLSALGVAAHEVGHAIQHAKGYQPLAWRSAVVPVANLGSTLSWPLVLLGFLFSLPVLVEIGIVLFSLVVIFQLITLPVEFNASSRAMLLLEGGFLQRDELDGARKVLNAAALTYVAATLMSVIQLMRLVGLSERRR